MHDTAMNDEQRERAEALVAANMARTGMSFEEQIVMAEYIFAGWGSIPVETYEGFEVEDADGGTRIVFTDTTVTDVG